MVEQQTEDLLVSGSIPLLANDQPTPMANDSCKLSNLLISKRTDSPKSWKRHNRLHRSIFFLCHFALTTSNSSLINLSLCFYAFFQPKDTAVVVVKGHESTEDLQVRVQQTLTPLFYDGFYLLPKSLV